MYTGRNPLACYKGFLMFLYGCLGCTPFSLWKEEIFKLITFLVVRIHNRMFRNTDLGPYIKKNLSIHTHFGSFGLKEKHLYNPFG